MNFIVISTMPLHVSSLRKEYVDALQDFVGLGRRLLVQIDTPTATNGHPSANNRLRRDYRGQAKGVSFSSIYTNAWLPAYRQYHAANQAACDAFVDEFEISVNVYGYSLRDPTRVVPSELTAKYKLKI